MEDNTIIPCKECPESITLIPPPDIEYSIPREKPTSKDHLIRYYQCEEGHRITIYWHKDDTEPLSTVDDSDVMRPSRTAYSESELGSS